MQESYGHPGQPRLVQHSIKGLFGGIASTEEETVEIISLEIEKIKGVLSVAENVIPAAKRDMLNFALRDKETTLLKMKEQREAKAAAAEAEK